MDYSAKSNSIGMQRGYAAQGAADANYQQAENAAIAPVSASETILSRLNNLRMNFSDNCQGASHAADKIVGSAPTPLNGPGGIGQIKGDRPPASCFIDALQQAIGELESLARDTQEHLGRIHRSF